MCCIVPSIAISLRHNREKMTVTNLLFKIMVATALALLSFKADAQTGRADEVLTKEILHMDSVLFNAFNSKDMAVMKNVFAKDLEFFHDKGGLTDYESTMKGFEKLFANTPDIQRQLTPGSTEVYPIKDYGAVQTGMHRFCHKENGKDDCGTFKFLQIWKRTAEGWKLARVVSYDH